MVGLTELVEKLENADEATKLEIMKEYEFGTIFKNIFNGIKKIIKETGIIDVIGILLCTTLLSFIITLVNYYISPNSEIFNFAYVISIMPYIPSIPIFFGGAILHYSEKYKEEDSKKPSYNPSIMDILNTPLFGKRK